MIFFVELVEGKDRPGERGSPEFKSDYGATGELMTQTTKPLFGTGKAGVMEFGCCLLKGLVGMLDHGVYGETVIKKKNIFLSTARDIPSRHASETRRLGVFILFCDDMDGHKYNMQRIKEANYVMKLFSTNGLLSKWCH